MEVIIYLFIQSQNVEPINLMFKMFACFNCFYIVVGLESQLSWYMKFNEINIYLISIDRYDV